MLYLLEMSHYSGSLAISLTEKESDMIILHIFGQIEPYLASGS